VLYCHTEWEGLTMKCRIFATAGLVTFAALGAANAADLPAPAPSYYKAPPPPIVYNWTGCYIAGGGGYGMWNQNSFVKVGGTPITAFQSNSGSGYFGQGQAGCDYQFNMPLGSWNFPLLIGAFGDWEGGNLDGNNSFPGFVGGERESSTWSAGGRAGYIVTPQLLTYFDGGWTQARFNGVNYNFAFAGGGPSGLSLAAQTYNGWFIGSGFEYSFSWLPFPGLFLKTEYRYSSYGGNNGVTVPLTGGVGGIPVTGAALNSQKTTQLISTELVWRFNWFGH
jgi:outer membrane immunogenic protein